MPLFRRRPLLRAAAVGGGAYMAGKRRAEHEQAPAPSEPSYGSPAPQSGLDPQVIGQLKDLGQLHDQGVLTDEEFAAQKTKLLG